MKVVFDSVVGPLVADFGPASQPPTIPFDGRAHYLGHVLSGVCLTAGNAKNIGVGAAAMGDGQRLDEGGGLSEHAFVQFTSYHIKNIDRSHNGAPLLDPTLQQAWGKKGCGRDEFETQ